jgi:hypothetical protein
MFLPREAGEGDHAQHGGGGMRAPERTFSRARELRRQMSLPEIVLWQALRKGRLGGCAFADSTRSDLLFSTSIAHPPGWRSR